MVSKAQFASLFTEVIVEAVTAAEQATGEYLSKTNIQIQLHGAGHGGDVISMNEAVKILHIGPELFYKVIDVGIRTSSPAQNLFVRASSHRPGPWSQTWNQPNGKGPFKLIRPLPS